MPPQEPSGIQYLLDHNAQQSKIYSSVDAELARKEYQRKHPTEACALKCMDGRVNLPLITQTPPGIIQPYRNLGGRFNFGWPFFQEMVRKWHKLAVKDGKNCLILVTYHFSKSDPCLGCRGWNYDTKAACEHGLILCKQSTKLLGVTTAMPIQIGIETDEDALIIHGSNGERLSIADELSLPEAELRHRLRKMFPESKKAILDDFLPLLLGNIEHVRRLRSNPRPLADADHREWVLAVGRGFDWLHQHNTALIVGPYDGNLSGPILTAATLMWDNIQSGRVDPKEKGIVLLSASPSWKQTGSEWTGSDLKAEYLAHKTLEIIRNEPKLKGLSELISPLVGVVNMETRRFQREEFNPILEPGTVL